MLVYIQIEEAECGGYKVIWSEDPNIAVAPVEYICDCEHPHDFEMERFIPKYVVETEDISATIEDLLY